LQQDELGWRGLHSTCGAGSRAERWLAFIQAKSDLPMEKANKEGLVEFNPREDA
jgi:hypothetical protein